MRRVLRGDSGRLSKRLLAITFAVGLIGLLGGCGGDGDGHHLSAHERARLETETDFAHCLRKQGLKGYPDPQVSENGYMLSGSPIDPGDKWQAAQEACMHVVDEGTPPAGADADAAG